MRGRPGCPTEQKKHSVGATGGSPLFSTRKGWVQDRPLIRPGFAGPPSPRGEGFGGGCVPSRLQHPPPPSPPSRGAGRYGRKIQGRRPGKKRRRTSPGSSKPEQGVQRGEPLPSGPLPPVSREKRGPPPGRHPTGRCAPRLCKSPAHPKGTQYRSPPPRRGLFLPKSLDKGSLIS